MSIKTRQEYFEGRQLQICLGQVKDKLDKDEVEEPNVLLLNEIVRFRWRFQFLVGNAINVCWDDSNGVLFRIFILVI